GPDWPIADLGIMGAGAVTVPIYQSNPAHECRYILEHSGACWVLVDGEAQARKIREVRDRLPALRGAVRFDGPGPDGFERALAEVEALGAEWGRDHPEAHARRLAA